MTNNSLKKDITTQKIRLTKMKQNEIENSTKLKVKNVTLENQKENTTEDVHSLKPGEENLKD